MTKGQVGDKMYVTIQGRVAIYLKVHATMQDSPVAILPDHSAVGDKALTNDNDKRSATVIAIDKGDTICLTLEKDDFKRLMQRQMILSKGVRFTFIVKFLNEIFHDWTKAKIMDINENYVYQFTSEEGSLVYDVGQPAEVFYIVREGTLVLETIIEEQNTFKYPVEAHGWEIKRTTKTL